MRAVEVVTVRAKTSCRAPLVMSKGVDERSEQAVSMSGASKPKIRATSHRAVLARAATRRNSKRLLVGIQR